MKYNGVTYKCGDAVIVDNQEVETGFILASGVERWNGQTDHHHRCGNRLLPLFRLRGAAKATGMLPQQRETTPTVCLSRDRRQRDSKGSPWKQLVAVRQTAPSHEERSTVGKLFARALPSHLIVIAQLRQLPALLDYSDAIRTN